MPSSLSFCCLAFLTPELLLLAAIDAVYKRAVDRCLSCIFRLAFNLLVRSMTVILFVSAVPQQRWTKEWEKLRVFDLGCMCNEVLSTSLEAFPIIVD